jgi:hypothetical protein
MTLRKSWKSIIVVSLLISLLPTQTLADDDDGLTIPFAVRVKPTACEDQLSKCDEALHYAEGAIKDQANTIDMLDEQNKLLQLKLTESYDELNSRQSWYNDPSIVGPLGLAIGAFLGVYISRH